MLNFSRTPGTFTGLALRISQFIFASGSLVLMISSNTSSNFTSFRMLIMSMLLQASWSFCFGALDAYTLVTKRVFHNRRANVIINAAGDWVMALLSLGAASASAAVVVFYLRDLGGGSAVGRLSGEYELKFQMSIAMAYMSWVTSGISALVMLWILAAH